MEGISQLAMPIWNSQKEMELEGGRATTEESWRCLEVSCTCQSQITAWRLLWNRLPTMDNLRKRIDIGKGEEWCCCCKTVEETVKHFFLECNEVMNLWYRLADWVGASWAAPHTIDLLWGSFSRLLGGGINRKRLRWLWVCVVWVLWK